MDLTPEQKQKLAEKILNRLTKKSFNDWYHVGRLDAYISGEPLQGTLGPIVVDKEEIIKDIKELFLS